MVLIAKGKHAKWLEPDGLILLQGWARDGLTEDQIAHNMGISRDTLRVWKNKFSVISTALKKGKEVVDFAVENALLKKALSGDVTAMIFWLKNRKILKWRDHHEVRTDEPGLKKVEELMDGLDKEAKDSTSDENAE